MTPRDLARLKQKLERLGSRPKGASPPWDPVERVRRFDGRVDRETAAIVAASLAYGRIQQILASLDEVFSRLSNHPARDARQLRFEALEEKLGGFRHRFTDHTSVALLLSAVGSVYRSGSSLGDFFREDFNGGIKPALASFVHRLRDRARGEYGAAARGRALPPEAEAGLRYLLASPDDGSACKRMNLFLRWMVRPEDGIDLGLWPHIPASSLVVPLDVHTARIARRLGLLRRRQTDWAAAEELTQSFRELDPHDPVRFDYALSHFGSEGPCRKKPSGRDCVECNLRRDCGGDKSGGQRRS